MCEDSASFDLTSTDISLCISDVDTILKAKKEEMELSTGTYTACTQYIQLPLNFVTKACELQKSDFSQKFWDCCLAGVCGALKLQVFATVAQCYVHTL